MKRNNNEQSYPLIILAGGRSERYGSPKGLAAVGDRTLISAHLRSFFVSGRRAVVVLGHTTTPYIVELNSISVGLPQLLSGAIGWTINPKPDQGPFSSLQAGLKELGAAGSAGVFVLPVDTGVVDGEIFLALAAASGAGSWSVIPEFKSRGGHPVFLGKPMVKQVLGVDPLAQEGRLDVQLRMHGTDQVVRLPVTWPEVLENRNTPI